VGFGAPLYPPAEDANPQAGSFFAKKIRVRGGLKPLPGSGEEVLRVAGLFAIGDAERIQLEKALSRLEQERDLRQFQEIRGVRFQVFLGAAASEAALKRSEEVKRARVLHLACHGEADLDSPALSHLALAQSEELGRATGEDGFLGLRELRDLQLHADLLVLSACETNAGRLQAFEGIAGLSRAAFAAGARSVLSTLWQVGDRETRDLMVSFYGHWLKDGLTRPEALARAKRAAIQRGAALKSWSAYILWDASM
jgi:CHAT domain-containing protein